MPVVEVVNHAVRIDPHDAREGSTPTPWHQALADRTRSVGRAMHSSLRARTYERRKRWNPEADRENLKVLYLTER
jgi:hypothetical protein